MTEDDLGSGAGSVRERIVSLTKDFIGLAIILAVVVGPPVWIIVNSIGEPLWATRTVTRTTTEHYGIIPEATPTLIVWGILMIIGWGMATGAFPRRI